MRTNVLASVLSLGLCLLQPAAASDQPDMKVGVGCRVSDTSYFPFPAGNDRCFKEINGRTHTPKSATACVQKTSPPRLWFVYSATDKALCLPDIEKPATKEEYSRGLGALARKEREFFLSSVGSR